MAAAKAVSQPVAVTSPVSSQGLERFSYDDKISRAFMLATLVWGLVATLVGLIVAALLAAPTMFERIGLAVPQVTFARLRPLHTNAAIFAFAGNAIFCAVYYSTQRLCKTRMFSDALSWFHFWGWQLIIVAAALTIPNGITQSKEYAELEWPIDIAITVVWVGFAINFFGTLAIRRERHMYVALWFYIATIITVAILHIFNNLVVPAGWFKSYPIYAGVQDAFMQWWYGHNAVAFFLTTPFLGLMYYFLPKAAERPVFSYRLSIIHFWSLVFIYIWAGPHHLHYTALPGWASTLGMLFSIMLWMPSWGGMINGLLTLRGAWDRVAADPILKFFVVGITFYGMATFEGPLLSVKSVNALSHYTDWTIAHVHAGALGWNGFLTFGMIYWLMPRLFQTKLASKKLAESHFWIGTVGILLYILPIYVAGLTQGLMWRDIDGEGRLVYEDFVETVVRLMPMYWIRVIGGAFYITGIGMLAVNCYKTWRTRPTQYEEPIQEAPALVRDGYRETPAVSRMTGSVADFAHKIDRWSQAVWHRRWERLPLTFTIMVTIAVGIASLLEIIPTFLIKSDVPQIATVKPYTPLELHGRDMYVSEGCYNCHSQMIRPILSETKRYGEYSKPGEFVYDHPFQWGSRRIGPDLAREGGKQSALWHLRHFEDPRDVVQGSIMPKYKWFLERDINYDLIPPTINAMVTLGVPYSPTEVDDAIEHAKAQAAEIAKQIAEQSGIPDDEAKYKDKQVLAMIAYLERLGTDLFATPEAALPPSASATPEFIAPLENGVPTIIDRAALQMAGKPSFEDPS